jgi:hypothetical protein
LLFKLTNYSESGVTTGGSDGIDDIFAIGVSERHFKNLESTKPLLGVASSAITDTQKSIGVTAGFCGEFSTQHHTAERGTSTNHQSGKGSQITSFSQ